MLYKSRLVIIYLAIKQKQKRLNNTEYKLSKITMKTLIFSPKHTKKQTYFKFNTHKTPTILHTIVFQLSKSKITNNIFKRQNHWKKNRSRRLTVFATFKSKCSLLIRWREHKSYSLSYADNAHTQGTLLIRINKSTKKQVCL